MTPHQLTGVDTPRHDKNLILTLGISKQLPDHHYSANGHEYIDVGHTLATKQSALDASAHLNIQSERSYVAGKTFGDELGFCLPHIPLPVYTTPPSNA